MDENSLRAVAASPSDVALSWIDPDPTSFCIYRDVSAPPLVIVNETGAVSFTDAPPAGPLFYYNVDEPATGSCGADCSAQDVLICGDSFAGRNDQIGSTDSIDAYPLCSTRDESGPEYAVSFTAPGAGTVSLSLWSSMNDLDLFVLRDTGAGCSPSNCIGFSHDWLQVWMEPGVTYYFVVDGFQGAVDDFWLDITCELNCTSAASIRCGNPVSGTNDQAGSTNDVQSYPCSPNWLPGPEYAYSFTTAGGSETVTATLANLTADLDVMIIRDDGSGCNPANCVASGDTEAVFTATSGTSYYIVVDGVDGAVGSFDLTLNCAAAVCSPVRPLACPDTVTARSDGPGSTDAIASYACDPLRQTGGPEITYSLTPAADEVVSLSLAYTFPTDLGIYVLEDRGAGCDPAACVQVGQMDAAFPAVQGEQYFVVVDGPAGGSGDFVLDVACPRACAATARIECGMPVAASTVGSGAVAVVDAWPACTPRDESGRERAYVFQSWTSSTVTATLSGTSVDLDLLILQDRGAGCNPDDCIAFGDTAVTFDAPAGDVFYVLVDGFQGAQGDFTLTLDCLPIQCTPAATIDCEQTVSGSNDGAGSTDLMANYPMCWGEDESGPEMVYMFTPTVKGAFKVSLSNMTADLDLMLLWNDPDGCSPDNCIIAEDSELTSFAWTGDSYLIAVDGRNGAIGSYDLSVTCRSCSAQGLVGCGETVLGRNDAPGSATLLDSYPACSAADASGPEFAYAFYPGDSASVTATLTGMSADLDIFMLEDQGYGCEADACIMSGDSQVTFPSTAFGFYYLVVDGIAGAVSDYTLSVQCTPAVCLEAGTIACGDTIGDRNDGPLSTSAIMQYPTCEVNWPPRNESGPEIAYRFDSADNFLVNATLTPASADLDLFVIDGWDGCDPDSCIAAEDTTSFISQAGSTYYLVVDGFQGAADSFTLNLTCAPAPFCSPAAAIACGDSRSGNNGAPASTDTIDAYDACAFGWDESGSEYAYEFSPQFDRLVTVDVTTLSGDHDVFIIEDYGTGCDAQNCFAAGDASVQFDAYAGATYYIIVDGPAGAIGNYDITVNCL